MPLDPNFDSVVLLMHCESAVDLAKNATITLNNGAAFTSTRSKFGSKSLELNGSSQYASTPNSSNYQFGTGPFTIEAWVYFNVVASGPFVTQLSNYGWAFDYDTSNSPNGLRFLDNSTGGLNSFSAAWTPVSNTWYAVAVDRDGSDNLRLYVDGVMIGKFTSFTRNLNSNTGLSIGSLIPSFNVSLNGHIDEIRLTKGVARYASDSGYTVATSAFPPADVASCADGTGFSRSIAISSTYRPVSTDSTSYSEQTGTTLSVALAEVPAIQHVSTEYTKRFISALDLFYSQGTTSPKVKFASTSTETVRSADTLSFGRLASLSDSVSVGEVLKVVQALRIVETLRLQPLLAAGARYKAQIAEAVRWTDAVRKFFSGEALDGLGIQSVVAPQYRPTRSVVDGVGIQQTQASKLVFRVISSDTVNLSDAEILKMLFKPQVLDGVEISAAYVSPDGNLTTWVVNTETGAVTEYSNYGFNSFAQIGHKYLGANSNGLYELNGDDDAGTDIIATIKSGLAQFGGSRFSMFKAAYLGVRGGGNFIFRLETGDGKYYDYEIVAQDMQTTKIRLGKGLRARYFSFQLTSTGQDFDMDSVEFVPLVAQRRV